MTSAYDISIYKDDLKLIEKWYIKYYGLKELEPPEDEVELFNKIVVLRKNEEFLETVEALDYGD